MEALNITVGEIDIETVGMDIAIEGERLDYDEIFKAIESSGVVVHSLDQLAVGNRIIERIPRTR